MCFSYSIAHCLHHRHPWLLPFGIKSTQVCVFGNIYIIKKKLGKISEIKENYGQPMIQFQSVELHRPVGGSVPPRQATDNGEWRWSILNCNWLLINTVLLGYWTGGKGCNLILAPGIFFFFFFLVFIFIFEQLGNSRCYWCRCSQGIKWLASNVKPAPWRNISGDSPPMLGGKQEDRPWRGCFTMNPSAFPSHATSSGQTSTDFNFQDCQ